jgi:hypothetical protein
VRLVARREWLRRFPVEPFLPVILQARAIEAERSYSIRARSSIQDCHVEPIPKAAFSAFLVLLQMRFTYSADAIIQNDRSMAITFESRIMPSIALPISAPTGRMIGEA